MKLLSFRRDGHECWGRLEGSDVVDLTTREAPTLRAALAMGTDLGRSGNGRHRLQDLTLMQPITNPDKIICVGINYPNHASETAQEAVPAHPSLFVRFPGSQVAHGEAVVCPRASSQFDFEGELAVVIGQRLRHASEAQALQAVAGYSCFAENSARDYQRHAQQVTAGKNFDRSGSFGPWLVTRDEFGDFANSRLQTRLNGKSMQSVKLGEMIFPVARLIAYITSFTELLPGDVIATGTPDGVGALRKPPVFLKPGDRLEVEIDGIGVLGNDLIEESP
jgi:2-keto-4-pentenoate hydratase/2-oxohepta-3-ene-1,7-dioic acid hydratase in catechol pathway